MLLSFALIAIVIKLSPFSTFNSSVTSSPEVTMSNLLARYNAAFASVSTTLDDSMTEFLDEVPPPSILNSSNMVPSAIGATATESYLVDRLRSVSNSGKYVEKIEFFYY